MPKRPLIFVIGDLHRNLYLHLPFFPKPQRETPAERQAWGPGGSAFNTAAVLTRLRLPTGVIGRVGNDPEGQALIREMTKSGIHTRSIQKDPEAPTGLCVIHATADGERSFIRARGANAALDPSGIPEALQGIRHLHVSGSTLLEAKPRKTALEALRAVRQSGATTSLDFTWQAALHAPEAIREALPHVLVALPAAPELRTALGSRRLSQAADAVLQMGVEQVAATLGSGGCRVYEGGGAVRVPGFEVPGADLYGARDAFTAGYICGLLERATPAACAVLGNAAAAVAAPSEGSTASLSRSKLLQMMRCDAAAVARKKQRAALQEAIGVLSRRSRRSRRRKR